MTIKELIEEAHRTAVEKGWWDLPVDNGRVVQDRNFGELIALAHSELSEALEEYRHGRDMDEIYSIDGHKPEGIAVELADLFIRIADTCGRYGIPLELALEKKMAFNRTRPYRHGGKKA
jgi:NTP pyrophosphatase (non-canonical NTP hydrolase)